MGELRESLRESGTSLKAVFANPGLRRVNIAFAGSNIGNWAFSVVIGIYAYQHGGPTVLGVVGVVRYVSMATLGPVVSSLGDRFARKLVMVSSDVIRAVIIAAATVIVATDGPALVVYVMATLSAVVGTAFRPAQAALLPVLASDPSELTAANVASSTIESVGFFAGPALAALLLAVANTPTVFAINAASFLWSATFVIGLSTDTRPPPDDEKKSGFVVEALKGFKTILALRDLRLLVALFFGQTVIAGASLVFTVTVALPLLHMGRPGVGELEAMTGVGGVLGGMLALVLAHRKRLSFDFGMGVILWSAPLLLLAAWPLVPVAIVMMFLIGVGNSLVDINAFTVLQRVVPGAVMARVFGALESLLIAGMALGALLMPLLIATVGLRSGLAIIGATVSVSVVAGIAGLNRIDRTTLAPSKLALISGNEILGPLTESVQEELARALIEVKVLAGGTVIEEGMPGDRFYLIESGTAEVTAHGIVVNSYGPGGSFGEIALLRDVPRQATVRATEDLTLYALERDVFLDSVTGHNEANRLANVVVSRFLSN
ncbi:MAG: MFS transporter [Acidimicrobiales bacterium]